MTKASTVSLSLRLLRAGINPNQALKSDHSLESVPVTSGELYVGQSPRKPPDWIGFLKHFSGEVEKLRTQSCSAVLFIEGGGGAKKRLFAICFGQGHHSLDEEAIQRGFGLRVVLNSVSRERLRTLDSASLDTTVMQRRVQASRDIDLSAFDLNANRDLLRLASGTPNTSDFAKALSGKDALSVRADIAPNKLADHCSKALKLFEATNYRKDFAFIDHVQLVTSKARADELDKISFDELKKLVAGQPSDLHLAIPDILSPEAGFEIGYYGAGLIAGSKMAYGELAIQDYVFELRRGDFTKITDMSVIKSGHEIRVLADGEGDKSHKQKLYRCLVHEVVLQNDTYVLFDGHWYLVSDAYHAEVDDAFDNLLQPAFCKSTKSKNERLLIEELSVKPNLISMDQTKVNPKGANRASLEPCDFLSSNRQLIHLKDGHSSAPLSHLWNQGLVSAEAFVSDETFRKNFRKQIQKRERKFGKAGFSTLLPDGRSKPTPGKYTIVFGVMRHPYVASGKVGLPFFSKVALRAAAERIALMGFPVELHLIEKR